MNELASAVESFELRQDYQFVKVFPCSIWMDLLQVVHLYATSPPERCKFRIHGGRKDGVHWQRPALPDSGGIPKSGQVEERLPTVVVLI